ncbi:GSCFA domain-containing protein [Dysgonomonas sp. ZJ709]|uniref:GSCFA domain-containing protein n=1 Tax=Dysgonomonas sp. ZJ709 TaxID=2709797 RepID=UPI0013EBAF8A|nr:GSCFA domain-containing protein [Dysgonomonas sp. ZJ709]
MDFRTKVEIQSSDLDITHHNRLVMLGSCFIESIGEMLENSKFTVNLNPFGILYNPQSISQALHILIDGKPFAKEDIFEYKGLFHSYHHHSRFSNTDKDECLAKINQSLKFGSDDLKKADILFITFGTAYVYKSKELDLIVSNCHKLPATQFDHYRLDVDTIVNDWNNLINELQTINPKLKILFTVSPIRHFKDGAHENQLSKSTLLLAVDEICKQNKNTDYFPSYEIVLDELRDYRFYNEDMIHPNTTAIKYIWERFSETYFSKETHSIINEWLKINSAIQHRPFNENSPEHKHFLKQTLLRLNEFNKKYPYICSDKEVSNLEARI